MKARITLDLLLLCGLCLLLLAPFLARPPHVDDPMFLWAAQHIVQHPLDFYSFSVNWEGIPRSMASIFPIPPLTSYFLAGAARWVGWNAIGLHLAFLLFTLGVVIGHYFLALQFCRRANLCVLLLLLCPGFWVSATTLMCEIPLLCFWVWGILFWIWGGKKSVWFFVPAAVVVALGVLTKFTALGLIPLLILHAILNRTCWRIHLAQIAALFFIGAVCISYDAAFAHLYGVGAFANASTYSQNSRAILNIPFGVRVLNTLSFVGGSGLAVCLLVAAVLWSRWTGLIFAVSVAASAFLLATSAVPPSGWIPDHQASSVYNTGGISPGGLAFYFQYMLLVGFAIVIAVHFSRAGMLAYRIGAWRDEAFLLAWIAGIFIFAAFVNWSINARSVLPMLPAICIMVVRRLDRMQQLPRTRSWVALSAGGIVALLVTVGDYHLALVGKSAADVAQQQARMILSTDSNRANAKLWMTGHWGLQYYLEPAGFTELDISNPRLTPGDYLLFPANGFGGVPIAKNFLLISSFTVGSAQFAATAEPALGAGFYHSDGYAIPFVFGPVPPQSFVLLKATGDSRISAQ